MQLKPLPFVPRLGDVGSEVMEIQTALIALGYKPGSVDGIFVQKTGQAISALQKAMGLTGSGVIGPKTLARLGFEVIIVNPISGRPPITKELKGKKSRQLHPALRLLIEAKVFQHGIIPQVFQNLDVQGMVKALSVALESLKIREVGGNNRGKLVGYLQDVIGAYVPNGTGDAWCVSVGQVIISFIEDFTGKESPVPDLEGVMATLAGSRKIKDLVSDECEEGTFFAAQNGKGWQGHWGSVLEKLPKEKMRTFEGNTGSGSDRDGDGAYFRTRGQNTLAGSLVVRGYIRIYPNNEVPT